MSIYLCIVDGELDEYCTSVPVRPLETAHLTHLVLQVIQASVQVNLKYHNCVGVTPVRYLGCKGPFIVSDCV